MAFIEWVDSSIVEEAPPEPAKTKGKKAAAKPAAETVAKLAAKKPRTKKEAVEPANAEASK